VHIVMPVQAPEATHLVELRFDATLAHPVTPSWIEAPAAQQLCPPAQSATGSAHCQSTTGGMQLVPMGVHAEVAPPASDSQQCCVPGVHETLGPPPVPLNGQ
jgi:hypothetical protein